MSADNDFDISYDGIRKLIADNNDLLDSWHAERGIVTERVEMISEIARLRSENTDLKASLSTARAEGVRDGMERAAKVAKNRWKAWASRIYADSPHGDQEACADIAAAIRALAEEGK